MNAPSSTCQPSTNFISIKFGSVFDPTYYVHIDAPGVNLDFSEYMPQMNDKPARAAVIAIVVATAAIPPTPHLNFARQDRDFSGWIGPQTRREHLGVEHLKLPLHVP